MNDKITKEIQAISKQIATILEWQSQDGNANGFNPSAPCEYEGFLKFTDYEVSKMPNQFKSSFRIEGKTVHYRKRIRGNSKSYEARYRRHGYNISVSASTLKMLKQRFIDAIKEKCQNPEVSSVPTNFHAFATYYFENFRKRKVSDETFKKDMNRYKNYIQPALGEFKINKITPAQCQKIIDVCQASGHMKNMSEIFSLLNVIFKMAIAHGILSINPLNVVIHDSYEGTHGVALTKEEESILLSSTKGTPYHLQFAVALYTGLRPNEYKTAKLEGEFIIAVNSKRKTKRVEYKKIPITPMLRPYLETVTALKFYGANRLREKFRSILPNHKLYDLRTTFYSRCQECGVADVARNVFVGHSLGKLGNTYTDLSDDFLLKEGNKIKY